MKKGNRALILVIGVIMLLFLGLIYAWSIFRAPLAAIFTDWTPTQISMTFTISIICFCTGGFAAGKLAAKIRHRYIILLSAAFILVGFSAITLLLDANAPGKSLAVLYIFYGVFGGGGVGLSYNTLLGVVARWFPGRAGMASGILLLGYGVGGLVLGSVVNVLAGTVGIRFAFLILGVALGVVLLVGSFFIRLPAEETPKTGAAAPESRASHTLGEAVAGPTFWLIFLWVVFMCIGGLLVINSAAPIAVRFGAPAVMGLIVSVFNGIGRPVIGAIFDRLGRKNAMLINTLILLVSGGALTFGATAENAVCIFIGLTLMGICYGGTPAILSAVVNGFYGPKNYQVILGGATFSLAVGAIVGPLLSSKLQERAGGEYLTSFIMLIVVAVIAIAINVGLNVSSRREGLEH